jgi:hypothetical protein
MIRRLSTKGRYVALIIAMPVSVPLVYLLTRPLIPDHINGALSGSPGDYKPTTPTEVLSFSLFLTTVSAAVVLVGLRRIREGDRIPAHVRWFSSLASLGAAAGVVPLLAAIGATDYQAGGVRDWVAKLGTLFVGVPPAIWATWLGPFRVEQAALDAPESTIEVDPRERVVWTSRSRSWLPVVAAVVFAIASATLAIAWSPAAWLGMVIAAMAVGDADRTVVVDRRGVSVRGGWQRRARLLVPLDQIKLVRAVEATPILTAAEYRRHDHGDEPTDRRFAVNRKGAALYIEFADYASYTISVDDADEGAEVLNGLLARLRTDTRATLAANSADTQGYLPDG